MALGFDSEQKTALEEVVQLYTSEADVVEQHCKKWSERTKNDANPWPKQGSFDPKLILQMEGKIYDHQHKDTSVKRETKRKRELQTLRAFMTLAKEKAGETGRAPVQVADNSNHRECEEMNSGEKELRPHPWASANKLLMSAGEQYPAVELKRELAEVVRSVVEIEQRLERAVREITCRLEHLEGGLRDGVLQADIYGVRGPAPCVEGASHKNVGGADAREEVRSKWTLSAPGSLTGELQKEEKNYDYLTKEDQGKVRQRLELEKIRSQDMEEKKEPENMVMGIGGVMGELAGGQEDDSPQGSFEMPVFPLRVKMTMKKAVQNPLGKMLRAKLDQVKKWKRERGDSDSDDGEESEIAEQCPVIMLTKKEKEEREKDELQTPVQAVDVVKPLITSGQQTHHHQREHTDVAELIPRLPILQESDDATHSVNRHGELRDSLETQDTERPRKPAQMLLENVSVPVQTPPQAPRPDVTLAPAPLSLQQPSQPMLPPRQANGPPPPAYRQSYWAQPPRQWLHSSYQRWGPGQGNYRGRGRGRGGAGRSQNNVYGPPICWVCGQQGHISRVCSRRQNVGGQEHALPQRGETRRLVSPYRGVYDTCGQKNPEEACSVSS